MSNSFQNLLHLLIIVVIACIFFWAAPKHDSAVHGILLPTHTPMKATNPEQVKIYRTKPAGSISLGLLNTSVHIAVDNQKTEKELFKPSMAYAKHLAAKSGATGLVFLTAYDNGDKGPLQAFETSWVPINTPTP